MKREKLFLLCTLFVTCLLGKSQTTVFDEGIRTAQLVVGNDPLLPPVIQLGKHEHLKLGWDLMSHEYQRYIYRIVHCTWDWQVDEGLFESEYLSGNDDLPVDDYETSFNTTQNYTHYSLTLPNSNTGFLLSGNYKILIYKDDEENKGPVLESRFSIWENTVSLSAEVTSNTDIDFNKTHQQISMQLRYPTLNVIDPYQQLHTVVMQNRLDSRSIIDAKPNIRNNGGLEWSHQRDLIFPAGNEYHRFEILDVQHSGMNVDKMRWYEPFYHAILWEDKPMKNYLTDKDQDGAFIPRTQDQQNNDTEAEYVIVHFALNMPRINDDIYVNGDWSNGEFDPACKMQYNEETECYEAAILLKQGYYNYQYITANGETAPTMGDFWETENEYQIFAYYREQGGRYDRLVAWMRLFSGL